MNGFCCVTYIYIYNFAFDMESVTVQIKYTTWRKSNQNN